MYSMFVLSAPRHQICGTRILLKSNNFKAGPAEEREAMTGPLNSTQTHFTASLTCILVKS